MSLRQNYPTRAQLWAELELVLPGVHQQLFSVRLVLRPIQAGEVKVTRETDHGWSDTVIRQALGQAPENLIDSALAQPTDRLWSEYPLPEPVCGFDEPGYFQSLWG